MTALLQRWGKRGSFVWKIPLATIALGICLLLAAAPAIAQETWLPPFDPNQTVYVDPSLANHPTHPVNLAGLAPKLEEASKPKNLATYVVASQQGSENLAANANWAVVKLDDLIARWRSHPQFPAENYVVILWVRRTDDVNRGWVAANVGTALKAQKITPQRLSAPDGPVISALKYYMPNDPKGAMVGIVENINSDLKDYQREQQFQKYGPLALLGAMFVAGAWVLSLIFRLRRNAARKAIGAWSERLANANELYLKLYDEYFEFLRAQSDWQERFQGETLQKYEAAVQDFSEFTMRLEAANQRLEAARVVAKGTVFPTTAGFKRAIELLTKEPVFVTDEELPLEMANLFSGLVPKHSYIPEQLLEAMAELFQRTHQALGELFGAVIGVPENCQQIEAHLKVADACRSDLAARDLPFAPYEMRLAQLQEVLVSLQAQQLNNPMPAYDQSQQVQQVAQQLEADLKRAIALKQKHSDLCETIQQAIHRTQTIRNQTIDYGYPLASGETAPPQSERERFALEEVGGNPNDALSEAQHFRQRAAQLLREAHLDDAEEEIANAERAAQQATDTIDQVLAAKSWVEEQVPQLCRQQQGFRKAIELADGAIVQLRAEFLAHNFAAEPGKLNQARDLDAIISNTLQQSKAAYDRQYYLQARRLLAPLDEQIQVSLSQLAGIHAKLKGLQQLRQQSRDIVERCQQLSARIAELLGQHEFTTALETEAAYCTEVDRLQQAQQDVAQTITDWVVAARTAEEALQKFQAIEQAILQEAQTYQQVRAKILVIETDIVTAVDVFQHPDITRATHQRLEKAQSSLQALKAQLEQPKSNWLRLSQQAETLEIEFKALKGVAEQEPAKAEAARKAIQKAKAAIRSAERKTLYGFNIILTESHSLLETAEEGLQAQNYQAAIDSATDARQTTKNAAEEAEQRQARLARERASRESSSHSSSWSSSSSSSSSSISSSSSSSSSSGSSYGGGGSGGGSYGGGGSGGGSY